MEEQVDARLDGRSFDMRAIQGQMMTAAVANMGEIQASVADAARSSQEMEHEMRERNADAQYEKESRAEIAGDTGDDPGGY
jgi:hypothetical protein